MAAISLDLWRRVLADCLAGRTITAIARRYSVSAEWVRLFYRRSQQTGEVAPRSHATKRQPFHVWHEAALRAAVAEAPDRTLEGLRAHLGLEVSIATLWATLHAIKISFKKVRPGGRAGRPAGRVAGRVTRLRPEPAGVPRRDVSEVEPGAGYRRAVAARG